MASLSNQQYFDQRCKFVAEQKAAGLNPYPHKFSVTISVADLVIKYEGLESGVCVLDVQFAVAGRIMRKNANSSKLHFYGLRGADGEIQVIADLSKSELDEVQFVKLHNSVKCGDIVGVIGCPGKSKRGELSIFSKFFTVLSHCLHALPMKNARDKKSEIWVPGCLRDPGSYILKNQETRYAKRFLDLIMNGEVTEIFKTRANIISYIRNFLDKLDFLEVETPIMNASFSIGAARPFVASNEELNVSMFMRVAPELHLKKLVVGGLERVYEIGKQFRCESIDMTHHPEFTTCEFYMAYADYNDLLGLTEGLLSGMVEKLTGSKVIKCHSDCGQPTEIDFTPPFRRIDLIEELEKLAGLSIPKDLYSEEAHKYLLDACQRNGLTCDPSQRTARLLDKLADYHLGGTCVNPTFIMNHPVIMSHLAKHHRSKPGLTERFELFVNKRELINAYTELNDPVVQRERFAELLEQTDQGTMLDETFCEALEYGLPPTAGWGIGIDRLVMLITDSQNIKEVLLLPQSIKKRKRENEV